MYRFVATRKKKKKKKKEIDPFLDTVCPFRASRVINVPICSYEEEKKKEIDPFLDTVCPLRGSRVTANGHETEDDRSLCRNIYCFVNLKVLSFSLNL